MDEVEWAGELFRNDVEEEDDDNRNSILAQETLQTAKHLPLVLNSPKNNLDQKERMNYYAACKSRTTSATFIIWRLESGWMDGYQPLAFFSVNDDCINWAYKYSGTS